MHWRKTWVSVKNAPAPSWPLWNKSLIFPKCCGNFKLCFNRILTWKTIVVNAEKIIRNFHSIMLYLSLATISPPKSKTLAPSPVWDQRLAKDAQSAWANSAHKRRVPQLLIQLSARWNVHCNSVKSFFFKGDKYYAHFLRDKRKQTVQGHHLNSI